MSTDKNEKLFYKLKDCIYYVDDIELREFIEKCLEYYEKDEWIKTLYKDSIKNADWEY